MENSLNKKAVTAILLAGILGVLVSVVLTKQHYAVSQKGFQEKSFCSISEFIDCDVAMVSPYAKIFGIPTSELSLLFYLFVTLSAGYLLVSKKEKILPFLLGLSLAGLFYSAFMAFVSFFRLKVLCLFCATLYLDILLLVVFLFWALKLSPWKAPLFFARYLAATFKKGEEGNHLGIHLLSIGLLFGIGLLFFVGLNQNIHSRPRPFSKALFQRAYLSQTEENFALPEGRPFWGDPNSSVTIVEFSDFQCPFCRVAAFSVKPFLGEYRDKVRLVSLQYPLDKSCNPNIEHDFHRLSCLAAKAALCAQDQGKYWDYFEEVFENQKSLSHDLLMKTAHDLGLEEAPFQQCLVSNEVTQKIQEDIALGTRLNVHGTPTLFINGRLLSNWTNPDVLQAAVQIELERKK